MVRERGLRESLHITPGKHLCTWHQQAAGLTWCKTWARERLGICSPLGPVSFRGMASQVVELPANLSWHLSSWHTQTLLLLCSFLTLSVPVGNPAATKAKHDSRTKLPLSPAQPVLWLCTRPQLLIWSCLPRRPVESSSGVSLRLTAISHVSTASFWARGQPFLTLNSSSELTKVSPKPNYEIFQGLGALAFPVTLFFQLEHRQGIWRRHLSILSYVSCGVANSAI